MNILEIKKNYLITGRASAGIYGILKERFFNKNVLLPCNICYAAVYPVIFSGNRPIFCDVDTLSGNVSLEAIKHVSSEISAMIIPHMFGNPVKDIFAIKQYCSEKNIVLIEDCASSMGATVHHFQTGSIGDYVIYSTGYSKTLDLGFGGIICSDFELKGIENCLSQFPKLSNKIKNSNSIFSIEYRKYRNKEKPLQVFLNENCKNLKDNFLFEISESEKGQVKNKLSFLSATIEERKRKQTLYDSFIQYNAFIKPYVFSEGAVPWRFNVLVDSQIRSHLIKKLLEASVPVSDWYPVVTKLFSDDGCYHGGTAFEQSIVNFPLICSDEKIEQYMAVFNRIMEDIE